MKLILDLKSLEEGRKGVYSFSKLWKGICFLLSLGREFMFYHYEGVILDVDHNYISICMIKTIVGQRERNRLFLYN